MSSHHIHDGSPDPITLEAYDLFWPRIFEREAATIRAALANLNVKAVEHVGSTAIPGMTAKPVVDIMIGAADFAEMPGRHSPLWSSLGYELGHGDDSDEGWLYFIKRDQQGKRMAHIHVVQFQGEFWNKMTVFRDALRADDGLVQEYVALKTSLAAKYPDERLKYLDGKAHFVARVIAGHRTLNSSLAAATTTMERTVVLSQLADAIVRMKVDHPVRVAIDGVDGAGKTTLADELVPFIEGRGRTVIRASIDAFHKPRAERYRRGPDSPEGFYFDSFDNDAVRRLLLAPLGPTGNRRYRAAAFDWRTDTVVEEAEREAPADAILLFDGIFCQRPELNANWDLCIFLDVEFEETLRRTLQAEWASTSSSDEKRRRFWARYAAGQKIYLESVHPKERAHIVVDNNNPNEPELIVHPSQNGQFTEDVVLRRASDQDVKQIAALFAKTRAICMPYLPVLHTVSEDNAYFADCVAGQHVWVAEQEYIVGFCAFGDGWLNHLYVDPDYHARGIGSLLLKIAADASPVLDLWVFQQNEQAIRFYESHGFVLVHKTDGSNNEERTPDAQYRWTQEQAGSRPHGVHDVQ